jgi:hypothetical protein
MPRFRGENFRGWLSNREVRFSLKVSRYTVSLYLEDGLYPSSDTVASAGLRMVTEGACPRD